MSIAGSLKNRDNYFCRQHLKPIDNYIQNMQQHLKTLQSHNTEYFKVWRNFQQWLEDLRKSTIPWSGSHIIHSWFTGRHQKHEIRFYEVHDLLYEDTQNIAIPNAVS